MSQQTLRPLKSQIDATKRDAFETEAASLRWRGRSEADKAEWMREFARRDPRSLRTDRVELSYDLRVLTRDSIGWKVRRRLGALSLRQLKTIYSAVRAG